MYGFGPEFETVEEAIACAAEHLGLSIDDFEEPLLPLPIDDLSRRAYETKQNLAVVDDGSFVVATATLPDQVAWPPLPWRFREEPLVGINDLPP
mgnify:FL=1